MPDRTIDQLEIQGPTQIRRPLTASAKIQTALDVSQKCSHIYNPLASKVIDLRVRKERATSSPKAILPILHFPRFVSTKQRLFHHDGTGSGCDGYVVGIFGHVGFSLSEANFVFHTQHKSSVQIPVFLYP